MVRRVWLRTRVAKDTSHVFTAKLWGHAAAAIAHNFSPPGARVHIEAPHEAHDLKGCCGHCPSHAHYAVGVTLMA